MSEETAILLGRCQEREFQLIQTVESLKQQLAIAKEALELYRTTTWEVGKIAKEALEKLK